MKVSTATTCPALERYAAEVDEWRQQAIARRREGRAAMAAPEIHPKYQHLFDLVDTVLDAHDRGELILLPALRERDACPTRAQ